MLERFEGVSRMRKVNIVIVLSFFLAHNLKNFWRSVDRLASQELNQRVDDMFSGKEKMEGVSKVVGYLHWLYGSICFFLDRSFAFRYWTWYRITRCL